MTESTIETGNGSRTKAAATRAAKNTPTTPTAITALDIRALDTESMLVPIVGTAPAITHRFSEKARRQMLDNMQNRKSPKEPKNPQAEYEAAMYKLDDGRCGIPALAFKQAIVDASRFYGKSVSMVILRMGVFVQGVFPEAGGQALIPITGEPHMREDVTTVGMGGHDLRYRPEFSEWSAVLPITYVSTLLTADSVLSLIQAAGMGVGVGEWRPERSGDFGTFAIDPDREITRGIQL
jgi:hypothetical protein